MLTVPAVRPGETVPAHALVPLQMGVAVAPVLADALGTRMVGEHGHVTGAHGVLSLQDRDAHE